MIGSLFISGRNEKFNNLNNIVTAIQKRTTEFNNDENINIL